MDEKEAEARLLMGTIFLVMNKSQELTVFHGRQKLTSANIYVCMYVCMYIN